MTLAIRNTIISILLFFSILLFAGFLVCSTVILRNLDLLSIPRIIKGITEVEYLRNILVLFFQLFSTILVSFLLHGFFKKTVSFEIFFFLLFMLSLSFESLRAFQLYLFLHNSPAYSIVTRAVYAARFFGTFMIFFSGLFASGFQYQRIDVIAGLALLVTFIFSTAIPVDTSVLEADLLYRLGSSRQIIMVFIILQGFAVLNFFFAGILKGDKEYFLLALGLFLTLLGKEIVLAFPASPLLVLGFVLFLSGAALFGYRTHEIYLWG
ncbi:MAG: hypothetical protein KAU17_11185 [Spirochaetales bacterium]|nr:hypothetical protein [Spirochaetales bacterium]